MSFPTESVWRIPLQASNAYLVDDGDVTLVDAGLPVDGRRILGALERAGFAPADVDRVLLTHFDLDHVGSLGVLDADTPVYVAQPDADYLAGRRTPSGWNPKELLQRMVGRFVQPPEQPISVVEDGDEIGEFTAVRTPGHTEGHTSYLHRKYGVLFAGDLVRERAGRLVASPWHFTADGDANEASVRTLADRLDGTPTTVELVAAGHGDPVRGGADALRRVLE